MVKVTLRMGENETEVDFVRIYQYIYIHGVPIHGFRGV